MGNALKSFLFLLGLKGKLRWFLFSIWKKSKKALAYLATVHLEAVLVTYLWTGKLFGSLGAVVTILAISFPTYILVENVFENKESS